MDEGAFLFVWNMELETTVWGGIRMDIKIRSVKLTDAPDINEMRIQDGVSVRKEYQVPQQFK